MIHKESETIEWKQSLSEIDEIIETAAAFANTKAGYMEDPNMTGEIKVLSVKKEKGCYLLKVKFRRDKDLD